MKNNDNFQEENFDDFLQKLDQQEGESIGCAPFMVWVPVAMLLWAALFYLCSCSPTLKLNPCPDFAIQTLTRFDTTIEIRDRIIFDTLTLDPEWFVITDTVPCPGGLAKDSIIYLTRTVATPGKQIIIEVPVRDTVRLVKEVPVAVKGEAGGNAWWINLIFVFVSAVLAWWVARRKKEVPK